MVIGRNDRVATLLPKNIVFKGHPMLDIFGNQKWANYHKQFQEGDHNVGIVPEGMEHRPDLIAYSVYGSPKLYWVILVANNIYDPEEALNIGDKIRLPKI